MDELVAAIVASYTDINPRICCSFGVWRKSDGDVTAELNYVCHAPLRWGDTFNKHDVMVTSYPVPNLKFFDYLKNIMFRKWSDHFHLEQTQESLYYIKITDYTLLPANVLYNFCIASRQPVEKPKALQLWSDYTDLGIHPAFAFAVCLALVDSVTGVVYSPGVLTAHWPLDNTVDLERLVGCNPVKLSVTYGESSLACTPTNCIWGETRDLKGLVGFTIIDFWNNWKAKHEDLLLASR